MTNLTVLDQAVLRLAMAQSSGVPCAPVRDLIPADDLDSAYRIQSALGRNNYKFSTLLMEIVKSDPFRLRRGKGQETLAAAK